jgi:hypothetical protein
LVLSGGGTNQTFFACGAVGCLVDNGLFDFNVISSISGGSLLLVFLDLCTSPLFNYNKKPDWYNRYVRKNMYKFIDCQFIATVVKNGFDISKMEKYMFEMLSDFNKKFDRVNTNVICEYNFIDANTKTITDCDKDIIDLRNNIEVPYWYIIRPLRCVLPFTNFNGRPTYDAGTVANIPVSSIFNKYKPKNIFFIHATPNIEYESYAKKSYLDLLLNSLSNIVNAANNSSQSAIGNNVKKCDTVIYCSMSNSLNLSKDKYHAGLFSDWQRQMSHNVRFYNGAIYNDLPLIKLIENEGYIEMYYQLKAKFPNRELVFKIPNPEVYNSNVKNIVNESMNKNIGFEFIKEIIKAPIL